MGERLFSAIWAWKRQAAGLGLLILAVMGMAFISPSRGADLASAVKVRLGGDLSQTRLVIESPAPVQGKIGDQGDQSLELSFSGLPLGDDMDGSGHGLVRSWALKRAGGQVKLSLDLTGKATVKRRFVLPPADGIPVYRYVVDLEGPGGAAASPSSAAPASSTPPAPVAAPAPSLIKHVAARPASADDKPSHPLADLVQAAEGLHDRWARKVIVIDAGHGGHDPGALGERAKEKDLTLAAAKTLKARLERTGKFKVVLTRDDDTFVPLEDRVQIARKAGADLFISLHADVGADPAVHGATVYTLSDQGIDRAARGATDSGSFLNVKLPGHDESVKQILLDLTQRNTRNRSSAFAENLIDSVGQQTELVSRSHRDAGYVVLLAPDVPAVLLEMGFITNHHDESELMDPARRGRLMDAVEEAIEAYFADNTKLALR
ncbi:MAG TPA: N-acetylmuramoyl-L-alanine amidase [Caulobacteraceae bacterium]|nr:N-acetylmuramoyl-L-alanine amidase [Caulobacteraceae bacterium]